MPIELTGAGGRGRGAGEQPVEDAPFAPAPSAFRRLFRNSRSLAALALILWFVFLAVFAEFLAPYPFKEQHRGREHVPPGRTFRDAPPADLEETPRTFLLGSDVLGRDVLSRVMHGARISLAVGLAATALSLIIGVAIGLLAGYFGGWVDAVLMRFTDTISAFPSLLLALAITALYERPAGGGSGWIDPSILILFVALGVVGWTGMARVVRAQVLSVKSLDYVTAARALGATHLRIMLRHILPNCVSPIIVMGTLAIGGNILGEAALSFLGLGVQDPIPSWGGMLSDSRDHFQIHWWVAVFPGLAIVLTVLAFNLLGDGLRDAFDPKSNRAG